MRRSGVDPERFAEINKAAGVHSDFDAWISEAKLPRRRQTCPERTHGGCGRGARGILSAGSVPYQRCRQCLRDQAFQAGIGAYWELSEITDEDVVRVLGVQDFQAVDIVAVKAAALKLAEETDSQWAATGMARPR